MKRAFTLAEVLITLTIIGVIAVLTIPNLMKKWEDSHIISGVKEVYSLLDNSIKQTIQIEGMPDEWDWPNKTTANTTENATFFIEKLSNKLKIEKKCGNLSNAYKNRCTQNPRKYYDVNGRLMGWIVDTDYLCKSTAILANGMSICVTIQNIKYDYEPNTKAMRPFGIILVDLNGPKKPNRYGYDVFFFPFDDKGIRHNRPKGDVDSNTYGYPFAKGNCSIYQNSIECANSCASWILRKGNVDYKYRDISKEWNW